MQAGECFEKEVQNGSGIANIESAHVDLDHKKKKKRKRPKNEQEQQPLEKVSRLANLYTAALEAAKSTSDECKTGDVSFDDGDAKSFIVEQQLDSYQLESSLSLVDDDVSPVSPGQNAQTFDDSKSAEAADTPLTPHLLCGVDDGIGGTTEIPSSEQIAPRDCKRKKKKDKRSKDVQSSEKVQRFASLYTAALNSTIDMNVTTSTNNGADYADLPGDDAAQKKNHEQIMESVFDGSSMREDNEVNVAVAQSIMEADTEKLLQEMGELEAEEELGVAAINGEKEVDVLNASTKAPLVESNSESQKEFVNNLRNSNTLSNEMANDLSGAPIVPLEVDEEPTDLLNPVADEAHKTNGTIERDLVDTSMAPLQSELEPTDLFNEMADALSSKHDTTEERSFAQSSADEVSGTAASNSEQIEALESLALLSNDDANNTSGGTEKELANMQPAFVEASDQNAEDLEGYSFHGVMELSPEIDIEEEEPLRLASEIDRHLFQTDPSSIGSLGETGVIEVVSESEDEQTSSLQDGAALLEALNAVAASVPMVEVLRPAVLEERKSSEMGIVAPLVPVIEGNASMLDDMIHGNPGPEINTSILDDYGGNSSMLDDFEEHGDAESPVTPDGESTSIVQHMQASVPLSLPMPNVAVESPVGGALSKASSYGRFVKQPPPPPPPVQHPGFLYPNTPMQQQFVLAPQHELKDDAITSGAGKDLSHTLDTQVDWSAIFEYQYDEADIPLEILSDDERA